ncbi:MAG: type II toxin-antitoxin system RelE/ParE family toxin [Caldilineaceae bacterium]|nr:type II toxin-antitoxin system RelE/ParE family toxin [Caldilineaceae bacterium]
MSASSYRIDLGRWKRIVDRAPGRVRPLLKQKIVALSLDPYPQSAKELGKPDNTPSGIFRIRVERWRIVYRVDNELDLVTILKIGEKRGAEFYEGVIES